MRLDEKESNDQHLGLVNEVLRVIFGLNPDTIDKVIRIIKSSKEVNNVKTQIMRQRIGVRAIKYLRNAVDIAREEGSEKHERGTEEEPDQSKDVDLEKSRTNKKSKKDDGKKKTNESVSFKGFLLNEIDARQAARIGTPDMATRRERATQTDVEARQRTEKEIADFETSDDPDKRRLAMLMKQMAVLRKRIGDKEARESRGAV